MRKYFFLLFIPLLFSSCFKDEDDTIRVASTLEIQNFIYRGLNFFYLYKEDTPELADDAFVSDTEKENFLRSFQSPEALFDFLKSPQDRFSRLFDDYVAIENALMGVQMSNGMEFGLVRYPDNPSNVFGYVRYVLPNSDASLKGLRRGDLFTTVDGTQLTESNYSALLSNPSYTIGLATYDGNDFELTGQNISLTKSQYDENPVHLSKVLVIEGQKIGYLMYTSFTRRYDRELNDVFGMFKAEGITDLIVDLRYNGGGSVETATDLASMITGQFSGQVFYHEIWNEDRQADYAQDGLFDNTISGGASINSLNLSRVYFITTQNTASASELVINGLDPYIDALKVGDRTTGKFQASFLLYDAPAPNFSRQEASTAHRYVMLPLVFKTSNKNGHTDFNDGLLPDFYLKENFFNLGELGDPNEPLLALALGQIAPFSAPAQKSFTSFEEIQLKDKEKPLDGLMIAEP